MTTAVLMIFTISTLLGITSSEIVVLHLRPPFSDQQPSVTHEVYRYCNAANFKTDDGFSQNLDALADSLTRSSSHVLYSMASIPEPVNSSNYVTGMYQCRGDISLSDCSTCVTHAFTLFRNGSVCELLTKSARVQYAGCLVRYVGSSSFTVESGGIETEMADSCSGSANESSQLYRENLVTALKSSATAAPQHPLFGYSAISTGSAGSNAAYVITQCLGSLNSSQCAACLSQVSNYNNICNGFVSGEIYYKYCYYLFGNTSLVFKYSNVSAPLQQSPVLSPVPSQPSPTITSLLPDEARRATNHTAAIVGIVVGTLALFATIAFLALCFFKRQRKSRVEIHEIHREEDKQLYHEVGVRRFSLKELVEATENFNFAKKLGEGGFGHVYQGRLKSGREVAIKMLSSCSLQGQPEFENEVNLITTVQHRNLIQLLGYCQEDNKQLLVYEYLPNRSLNLSLFDVDETRGLDWRTRFHIIVGIARGLTYLHEESPVRIIHRDIKASNILLDNNFEPKIADFGLARLFGDDKSHLTTRVAGTLGYLAPEYAIRGQLSEKADVYSFGLLVLEILSGRRVMETKSGADQQNLLDWTWGLYEKHQQLQILDERVQKTGEGLDGRVAGEVVRQVHVALLCTQLRPQSRPSMSEVQNMLRGQYDILNVPAKPVFVDMLSPIADPLRDGTFTMSSSSSMQPSPRSVQSTDSLDANSISQVEAR